MGTADILRRLGPIAQERGALPVAAQCTDWGVRWTFGRPRARGTSPHTFRYEGEDVAYFWHPYHHTWLTERAVEIPLAQRLVARHAPERVVEIGNVLGHYQPRRHLVVDKYERAPGVHNVDVVDLDLPPGSADLVVAISTLEHVGLDEPERDPGKPARAVDRLLELLAPGGRLWVTVPVNYNEALDDGLRCGTLPFRRLTALRRVSASNRWRQVEPAQVWSVPYDRLLFAASGLVIAEAVAPGA